jgi:hypothetical protein
LAAQIAEKQIRQQQETDQEKYYREMGTQHIQAKLHFDAQKKMRDAQRIEELKQFNMQLAHEKRARDQIEYSNWTNKVELDPNSKFLKFEQAKDKDQSNLEMLQSAQQKVWLDHQVAIKQKRDAEERLRVEQEERMQAEINALKYQSELEKQRHALDRIENTKAFNMQLAAQKQQARMRQVKADEEMKQMDIMHNLTSDLLREKPREGAVASFKGFSPEQSQAIINEQYAQVLGKQARLQKEKEEAEEEARRQAALEREIRNQDRFRADMEKKRVEALRAENLNQHKQKILRDQYFNNSLYTNSISDEFFKGFGSSAR